MADTKPVTPRNSDSYVKIDRGAIPRMGMNIPMPAGTKPPRAPSQPSNQKAAAQK